MNLLDRSYVITLNCLISEADECVLQNPLFSLTALGWVIITRLSDLKTLNRVALSPVNRVLNTISYNDSAVSFQPNDQTKENFTDLKSKELLKCCLIASLSPILVIKQIHIGKTHV